MEDCIVAYGIAIVLLIISITFIIMTISLKDSSKKEDLVKIYKMKKKPNETITRITNIRKSDGTSCDMSYVYEDGKEKINCGGKEACKEPPRGDACII